MENRKEERNREPREQDLSSKIKGMWTSRESLPVKQMRNRENPN